MKSAVSLCLFGLLLTLSRTGLALEITDSTGVHHFDKTPQRVIALSWNNVENLVELDITPLAIADIRGYNTWVAQPALPEKVADVGVRHQPSLERIARLKPDLIIIGSTQGAMLQKLKLIAPVLYFDDFHADHDNEESARSTFIKLARLFDREELALQKLEKQKAKLNALRQQVADHFNGEPPSVDVVRLTNLSHVYIHDSNSMVHAALSALGLKESISLPASTWGVGLRPMTQLTEVEGVLLQIEPFPLEDKLFNLPFWKAMPFANARRQGSVEPAWSYGGISSRYYMAEKLSKALLELPTDAPEAKP